MGVGVDAKPVSVMPAVEALNHSAAASRQASNVEDRVNVIAASQLAYSGGISSDLARESNRTHVGMDRFHGEH
jgi:hypothetical protein